MFLRRTDEPAIDLDMRLITANVEAELHDLRTPASAQPAERPYASVLDPQDYGPSQRLGRRLRARAAGASAIRACAMPRASASRSSGRGRCAMPSRRLHIALHWDGERITHWFEKRAPHPLTTR